MMSDIERLEDEIAALSGCLEVATANLKSAKGAEGRAKNEHETVEFAVLTASEDDALYPFFYCEHCGSREYARLHQVASVTDHHCSLCRLITPVGWPNGATE